MIFSLFRRSTAKLPKDYLALISKDAIEILSLLADAGHESYLVGGCVRDILLKRPSKDFDIATSATPEEVKKLIPRSQIIGRRFKIVVARRKLPFNKNLRQELFPVFNSRPPLEEYQITTFRSDPVWDEELQKMNENVYGDARDDAYRRDFTINALFLDPLHSKIVDYVGGNKDIKARLLRMIGSPKERFKEDPIRILRALRFIKRNQLKFEEETGNALKEQLPYLKDAKKERVREEVLKIWREGFQAESFEEMKKLGMWRFISPLYGRHLEINNHAFEKLLKLGRAVAACPWKNPRQAAPFFFFMESDYFLGRSKKGKSTVAELMTKLNASKKEAEDIQRVKEFIHRISSPKTKANRLLRKHFATYESLAQSFYVLKILADTGDQEMIKHWKNWEKDWIQYKNECVSLFGRPRRTSSTRGPRGRGRRRRSRS